MTTSANVDLNDVEQFLDDVFPRIGDLALERTGGNSQRAGQVDAGFLVAHAAGVITVGSADAAQGAVEPAERVAWPAQASGTGRWAELGASVEKDLLQCLAVELLRLQG